MSITELLNTLVDDINGLDFTYQTLDPQVKVYRYGEGFSRENPTVLIQFLPANRKRFQSVGDVIGKAKGDYYRYGYCRVVLCTIHCYCSEDHKTVDKTTTFNGRILCEYIAEKCQERIVKVWENILFDYYASFDRKETVPILKDLSTYDPVTETRIYNYDIDVYLRIPFTWDKVPEGYEETDDLAEIVEFEVEETQQETKDNIIIKII